MGNTAPSPSAYHLPTRIHWQLWIGLFFSLFIILGGLFGSSIAPRDPLKENFLVFINDDAYVKPPFPAFLVPGFPLGSDEFGRDILSRLLWGIRPTLILVLVTSSLRLIIGVLIGLIAGWSSRRAAQIFNTAISLTAALPVLFVALIVIAATGQKLGLLAFIIGLSITGWGDVARMVREQTRIIKSQLYIEAAQALGSSSSQMLRGHVLPQVMPSIWMMLAFEISGSLLITAELGVLGYFFNAVWIPIGDWVGLRTTGMPELSQMLGSMQTQPWAALGAGIIIFSTILGFNLLGEGLRTATNPEISTRPHAISQKISNWVDDRFFSPQAAFQRNIPAIFSAIIIFAILIGGGGYLWQTQTKAAIKNVPPLPGNHMWVSTLRDSQGTLWAPVEAPSSPGSEWSTKLNGSIPAGPVVDVNGNIYIATSEPRLYVIAPSGATLWSVPLPNPPLGFPALTPSGIVYITDTKGGITGIRPDKSIIESVKGTSTRMPALTGALVGSDNSAYYANTEYFYAINPDGTVRWKKSLPTYSITSPIIRLSQDEKYLLFEDFVFTTVNGEVIGKNTPEPLDRLLIASNGQIYRFTSQYLEEYNPGQPPAQSPQQIKWDARALGTSFRFPRNGGVTPEGYIWLHFGNLYEFSRIVWLDQSGATLSMLDYPYRGPTTSLIAIDKNNIVIVCGSNATTEMGPDECRANTMQSSNPIWKLPIEGSPTGGALVENRLYITTTDGYVHAFANSK